MITKKTREKVPGRGWAWFGFVVGIIASVAGNIAHQFVKNGDPKLGAIVWAALWPVSLMIALEVLTHTPWPRGVAWKSIGIGGVALVAAVAAVISYKHLHALMLSYGEDEWSAAIGPLAVDGLMAVCSAALLATSRHRRRDAAPSAPQPTVADLPQAARTASAPETDDVPVEVSAPDPAATPAGSNGHRKAEGGSAAAEWRRKYDHLLRRQPNLTRKQAAELLGVSDRTLRTALNTPSVHPTGGTS